MVSTKKRFAAAVLLPAALALLLSARPIRAHQGGAAPQKSSPAKKRRPAQQGVQHVSDLEQQVNAVLLQQSVNSAQLTTLTITQQQMMNFGQQQQPMTVLQQRLTAVQQQMIALGQQQQLQALQQQLSAVQIQPFGPLATLQLGVLQQQAAAAAQQDVWQQQQLTALQQQIVNALRQPGS
jgi:hypothetical protein